MREMLRTANVVRSRELHYPHFHGRVTLLVHITDGPALEASVPTTSSSVIRFFLALRIAFIYFLAQAASRRLFCLSIPAIPTIPTSCICIGGLVLSARYLVEEAWSGRSLFLSVPGLAYRVLPLYQHGEFSVRCQQASIVVRWQVGLIFASV